MTTIQRRLCVLFMLAVMVSAITALPTPEPKRRKGGFKLPKSHGEHEEQEEAQYEGQQQDGASAGVNGGPRTATTLSGKPCTRGAGLSGWISNWRTYGFGEGSTCL